MSLVKWFYSFLVFLLLFFSFRMPVLASAEFDTSYQGTYTITSDGKTLVDLQIIIKNNLPDIYISQYSVTVGATNLANILAWDSFGPLTPEVTKTTNRTQISVNFTNKAVGKNKTNLLKLRYETPDFSAVNGSVLEVTIPGMSKMAELIDYQVDLIVPQSFGPVSFIQPKPDTQYQENANEIYHFSKGRLSKFEGVTAAFGDSQVFDFSLNYQLKNPNKFPGQTEIVLPADTGYQQVSYSSIAPRPIAVREDQDSNWLATYYLDSDQELNVIASGSVQIFIKEQSQPKNPAMDQELLEQYLKKDLYWEVDDPLIKTEAKKLGNIENIYRFVSDTLIYDYGRLSGPSKRLGALNAITNPESSLCMEFTDLFIALARAQGIPAREVDGFAYTPNPKLRPLSLSSDVLHAWPEYYDSAKNVWIPVDPTWENTTGGIDFFHKLDLNHFAFVRHGIKSNYPAPPGAYSLSTTKKNINVWFGKKELKLAKADLQIITSSEQMAGLLISGKVVIKNSGQIAIYNQTATIRAEGFEKTFDLTVLPPYASFSEDFSFSSQWNQTKKYTLELVYNNQAVDFEVQTQSFYIYLIKSLQKWFRILLKR